jgi:hypothetical protein
VLQRSALQSGNRKSTGHAQMLNPTSISQAIY